MFNTDDDDDAKRKGKREFYRQKSYKIQQKKDM
jgi:hypothetical protein